MRDYHLRKGDPGDGGEEQLVVPGRLVAHLEVDAETLAAGFLRRKKVWCRYNRYGQDPAATH